MVLGVSGLEFTDLVLSQPDGPKLTLYVRNPSKLPAAQKEASPSRIRIVEGRLDDPVALKKAMTDSARPVETVVSFLGAYPTLQAFLLRTKATPIADAFPTVFTAMRECGVKRILALSTPAWLVTSGGGDEKPSSKQDDGSGPKKQKQKNEALPWDFWMIMKMVPVVMPQGHREMYEIARRVIQEGENGGWGLKWTVFRVPHLNDGPGDEKVSAGLFGHDFIGTRELSRKSLVRWVLKEAELGEWINQVPVVGNY